MLNQSQICNTAVLVLLCYKIWIRSSPDQSWQAFQTGYRLREAMSPKLDLAGIPERRDTVVLEGLEKFRGFRLITPFTAASLCIANKLNHAGSQPGTKYQRSCRWYRQGRLVATASERDLREVSEPPMQGKRGIRIHRTLDGP